MDMFESSNYFAEVVLKQLVNAALPGAVAIALTSLMAWHKGWNAASRYCAWWLMLGLLAVLPFFPGTRRQAAPAAHPSTIARMLTIVVAANSVAPIEKRVWPSPVAVFLFCWIAAACLQLVRVGRGLWRGVQLKRSSRSAPPEVEVLFADLCRRTGVSRCVVLRVSERLESPAVLGYRRPQVLLPTALIAHLSHSELQQILLHELAHVKRRDDWTIVLQRTVEALSVFHPLVAYLAHRMNLDREIACDDAVAAICEPGEYAACLTRVAEIRHFGSVSPVTVPLLLERKSELLSRVESLLDGNRAHRPGVSFARLVMVLACGTTVGVAGAFTPRFLAVPAAPQQAAAAVPKTATKESSSVSSIAMTGEDGSTSNFGSWSRDEKGEPGTITYNSGGKRYVIRDRSTVSEAKTLLRPMEELGQKQAVLGEKQAKLGERQVALGAKQAALATAPLDMETTKDLQAQLRELESKIHQMDLEKEIKTAEDAMSKLGDLQARIGDIQSRMGSAQGLMGEAQGRLGEAQGKLGEEQGRLGEQQGQLGQQQERASKLAKRQLQQLIRRAEQRGLAQPLP